MQNHHLSFLCHFYDVADFGQPVAGHKTSTWVVGHATAGFVVVDCCLHKNVWPMVGSGSIFQNTDMRQIRGSPRQPFQN